MGVELDPRYQIEAYDAIQSSIKETGKAGIVLPTGTGKTYLALKLIEDNLDKDQILYVSPSPTINVQVRKKIKEIYPKEEAEQILSKVKFVTYSGLDKRFKHDKFDMKEYNSDVIVLDEVHRSGAEDWGKAVDYLLETNSNAQVLGMTATPLRSDGQNMIEKRFGETAYELKLSEAVARGILTLPTYISSRYIFEEDILSLQEKIDSIEDKKKKQEFQEKLDKAKKSVENASGVKEILKKHMKDGKWLVFCNPGDNIEELQEQAKKEGWFDEINENQTFLTVESTRTDSENDMALRTFERKGGDDLRILYSKNMLNEGIHDEEITGEIMLRPTKSYILFTQQLGRILSKDRPEEPIVLDLVGNIKYFKEFRLEIQNIIREGIERGDTRYNEKILEQFKILEEQEDFIQVFEEIEASIEEYMSKTSIQKTLDILEALKKEGIDVTKIQKTTLNHNHDNKTRSTYLYEVVPLEIIEKLNLDSNYKIGRQISSMLEVYKGNRDDRTISEGDIKRIQALGFEIEEKRAITETLDILEILKNEGVDLNKEIQQTKTESGKTRGTLLYEIHNKRIEEIITKYNLDRQFPIGDKIYYMMKAFKGTSDKTITDEERARVKNLGFDMRTTTEKTLDILEMLQAEEIDVAKIQKNKKVNGKMRYTYLHEVVPNEIIEKIGLDPNEKIGGSLTTIKKGYRRDAKVEMTDEQRKKIEDMGLVTELDKRVAEQNLLKKKQAETKKLKSEVQQELDKQNKDKDIGDADE